MTIDQQIKCWSELGKILFAHANKESWKPEISFISEEQYLDFEKTIVETFYYNGWFDEAHVRQSLLEISSWLTKEKLTDWIMKYGNQKISESIIVIIMAGNIPIVGFHDLLCVLLSGFKAKVKLSSEDNKLIPGIIKYLEIISPVLVERILFTDRNIGDYDAIIATGDNLSNQSFQTYFSKKPHLFRNHRTSIAILNGQESQKEITELGEDIFKYYGRGCRNVTHLCVPKGFNLELIFKGIYPFANVIQNKKYGNNYDYNKAIHLMNQEEILDNNFVLLKKTTSLHAPIAMLYYHEYNNKSDLDAFIEENKNEIQCIIGNGYLSFGSAQKPRLNDYADNIDTMQWLLNLQ